MSSYTRQKLLCGWCSGDQTSVWMAMPPPPPFWTVPWVKRDLSEYFTNVADIVDLSNITCCMQRIESGRVWAMSSSGDAVRRADPSAADENCTICAAMNSCAGTCTCVSVLRTRNDRECIQKFTFPSIQCIQILFVSHSHTNSKTIEKNVNVRDRQTDIQTTLRQDMRWNNSHLWFACDVG